MKHIRLPPELTNVELVVGVFVVEQLQQPLFNERLLVEGSLVLDDLDGHPLLVLYVVAFHHLHTEMGGGSTLTTGP